VFIAVLAALICVNLVYFLSTHTRIMHQLHVDRQGALMGGQQQAAKKFEQPDSSGSSKINCMRLMLLLLCFVLLCASADGSECNPLRLKHLRLPSDNGTAAVSSANGTAATPSSPAAAAVEAPDEHAAVRYLQRAVFYDKTRMPRKPVENFWLPEPGAKNQTFKDYRAKVAAYLNSTEFKQRWDALKQQVSRAVCYFFV
jgi:hypothetical protein